jgi:erythromycin esterase
LHAFNRWPSWMWANWEIIALAGWLQRHNAGLPANKKTGFYGLDVYSLWESMESIMQYLSITDKAVLKVAEEAFRCFEPYRGDEDGPPTCGWGHSLPRICGVLTGSKSPL